jgi:hypothetical protein
LEELLEDEKNLISKKRGKERGNNELPNSTIAKYMSANLE